MKKLVSAIVAFFMLASVFAVFPVMTSAASMSDAGFFAKFNYAAYPGLSEVQALASAGDYDGAKAALLTYFKERHAEGRITGFGVSEADENYSMAVLPMRNILTGPYEFDMWAAEFTVTSAEYAFYEADVTDRVAHELDNGAVSFMLFAGDKQQYPVYVKSKEAGEDVAPKLEITYDIDGTKNTVTVTADNDTYISSGNTDTTYGSETVLNIKEDGSGSDSTGSNTRRTYINFPITEAANSTIVSAKLILNAAYASDCTTGDKDVLVISIGDTVWSEDSLTWAGTRGSIYSYQDADVPTWGASAPNADSEYHNVTSRFWFGKPMAYEYLSYLEDPEAYNESHPYADVYPGAEFGPKLVELMSAFASQRAYGYTRTLETGERLNRWVDIVDAFLETDVFDDRLDEFCNIISFMWGDCSYLNSLSISNDSVWWSNWRIVANAGFFKAVEYFPEFLTHSTWREKVEYNVEYTLDLLYNDDFSFTEAGPSYAAWCAKLFGDCVRAASMSGNPMNATAVEKIKYAARNALESYYPNGYDTNIGDSNYRDQMSYFELLDETFNYSDFVIHSYATGSDKGAEYLTHYYADSNSAYMRNSWDPDEAVYINFTNNPNDGHYHPDSNQVLLYAYGQPLLVDSGRYSYSSTNSIYDTLRTAASHNTIEADGLTLGAHSSAASADSLLYTATNDTFDFTASEQHGYSGVSHTRNVFFAHKGFAIVTDYVSGSASRKYSQNWHFLPSSNAEADGNTVSTDFYQRPNVTLAAASADSTAVLDGYHSADYGLVAASKYASFSKTGTAVKFDTLIYPTRTGESVEASATDLAPSDSSKAAVELSVDGETAYYYVKNTDSSDGVFGSYTTDAKMAYVSDGEYMLTDGKSISDIIKAPNTITSIAVTNENGAVTINGQDLTPSTDKAAAIAIYAPNAASVTLNGQSVSFVSEDGFIYAAASNAPETVTVTEKVYPDKDGFVASSTGNEGPNNTTIIQTAASWQNRNAYLGLDLSAYASVNITKAALKMKVTEVANSPGTLHGYFLDYGTWTRSNLSFVLDSSKMPSHTANSGTYTGYSYHWSGSLSALAVGDWTNFDVTSQLTEYLANGGNSKFTWALLSSAGSVKYSSINAEEADRPYLEITYTKTIGEAKSDPTVTVKKYADGVLKSTSAVTAPLGSTYLYEGDDKTTDGGVTYYINADKSTLSTIVKEDGNVLNVYYESENTVTVTFTADGTEIANSVSISVSPNVTSYSYAPAEKITYGGIDYYLDTASSSLFCNPNTTSALEAVYVRAADITVSFTYGGTAIRKDFIAQAALGSVYTYSPKSTIVADDGVYELDEAASTLSCTVKEGAALEAAYTKVYTFTGENLVTDGSFEDANGNFSWGDWLSPNGENGKFADNCEDWFYKVNADTNEAALYQSGSITASDYALGSRWSDSSTGLCSLANFIPVEKGKTYFVGYNYKHVSGAENTYIVTSFVTNNTSFDDGSTIILTPETATTSWNYTSTLFTPEEDGYVYFHFRWLGDGSNSGNGPFWYFDDFAVAEASEYNSIDVYLDGKTVHTGGTIALGDNSSLPEDVAGYYVEQTDGSYSFVSAGDLGVEGGEMISTVPVNVSMVTGAQVRYGDGVDADKKVASGSGLRFIAQIDRSSLPAQSIISGYGMEITAEGSDVSFDIPAETYQDEDKLIFTAAVTNLLIANYNRTYTARPYVIAAYSDGAEEKIYSSSTVSRSIYQVSAGLLRDSAESAVTADSPIYNVLNAYVNMVGIRLTYSSDGTFSMRDSGSGAYTGDILFDVTSTDNGDNSYTVTVSPVTEGVAVPVGILSYWNEFIRINNNHSTVIEKISDSKINEDGSITFTFTVPSA